MIDNVKVGDKVWLLYIGKLWETEVLCVSGGSISVIDMYGESGDDLIFTRDWLFPSLEPLLQHLKDNAVYLKEPNDN